MNSQDHQRTISRTNSRPQINTPHNQIPTTFIQTTLITHQTNQQQQDDIPESSSARNSTNQHQHLPRSFLYDESAINEGLNICQCSIIGKIITDKPIHAKSIQNGLENI
jgi:hypothetical protein